MTERDLTATIQQALALSASDRERLTADFARMRADARRDALPWSAISGAMRRSHDLVQAALTHSHAAARLALRHP